MAKFEWTGPEPPQCLIDTAVTWAAHTREAAHVPVTGYKVGAAIVGESSPGSYEVRAGCNIEFGNLSNTIHAEEAAIAASMGHHSMRRMYAIAVVTEDMAWPCGMCLQSLYELAGMNLLVVASDGQERMQARLKLLVPYGQN